MTVSSRRVLDPVERTLEVLFGVIMVLVFTASIDAADAGAESVREVLVGAIGCNLAWGVVDAAMYLMATFADRARGIALLQAIRSARDPQPAYAAIAGLLPAGVAAALGGAEFETLRRRLTVVDAPRASLGRDDYFGALGVFLLVSVSTFPLIVPFLVLHDVGPAIRTSEAIGAVMLLLVGWNVGAHTGRPGWRTGLATVALGAVLTAITFALGG